MERQFNEDQKKAISHGKGPAMVLAGPGSGKTLVITYRVKWLIEEVGIHPHNILVVTFTRAAAREMEERFHQFEGMQTAGVMFGTFHSVFFMILRHAYRYTGNNILREEQKRAYIKSLVEEMELEIEDENDFYTGILGEISYVKGEMLSLSHYHSSNLADELFIKIFKGYEEKLRSSNQLDFDDMLVFCYDLLKERPDILKLWQDKFQYILIDEFQDINRVQYEIVKLLAGSGEHLFIVGDDDQSIYRFRGAKPEIMLKFGKDFPGVSKYILHTNYRCSEQIVTSAARLIKHNQKRFEKNMQAARGSKVPVTYKKMENISQECTDIIHGIQFYYQKGIPLEDMAVIFRTNTQPRLLVGRLMEYNIPFWMRDRMPNLFEHWIAKNILAYIELALGNRDRSIFLQVMNRPKRYIARNMLTEKEVSFSDLKQMALGKQWLYERIDKLEMDLKLLKTMEPYAAIQYIRKGIGYEDYLFEYAQFRKMKPEDLEEVFEQIQESSKPYHTFKEWFDYIEQYGENLKEQRKKEYQSRKRGVTLTTMHSAKGLEYEVVFIMDVNDGICPHKKAVKEADLEEERRLFYVAVTRAKTYLFLYTVKEMYQKEIRQSGFINEVRHDPEDYAAGKRVRHKKFGEGTVISLEKDKITILFDEKKVKKRFSLSFVLENNILDFVEASSTDTNSTGGKISD